MKYVLKTAVLEATQWWKNGDHPQDESTLVKVSNIQPFLSEGKVVRRFRTPGSDSKRCEICRGLFVDHGWIDQTPAVTVCPGDYIVEGDNGVYSVRKPKLFEAEYRAMPYLD